MPVLPSADSLKRTPAPASTPGIAVRAIDYGPMASASKALADGIKSIGGAFSAAGAAQDEVDDYATRKQLADFKLATEMKYVDDERRGMPQGGLGFSDSWNSNFKKQADAFFGEKGANIAPSQRAKVDLALVQHQASLSERAQRAEMAERDRFTIEGLGATVNRHVDAVQANPDKLDDYRQEGEKIIEMSPISPAAKAKLAVDFKRQMGETAFKERVARAQQIADPAERIARIEALRADLKAHIEDAPDPNVSRETLSGPGPSFNPAINSVIDQAAAKAGVPAGMLRTFAKIESGGQPGVTTGSYKGLFQLSEAEFRKHGGEGNIYDPQANAEAAARKLKVESETFAARFGREPTAAELYMVHQQGEAGSAAHMSNPGAPAWQNMASTGEGRQKGAAWAKQAIWGNVPDADKARFGSVENISSADFMGLWQAKVEKFSGGPSTLDRLRTAQGGPTQTDKLMGQPLADIGDDPEGAQLARSAGFMADGKQYGVYDGPYQGLKAAERRKLDRHAAEALKTSLFAQHADFLGKLDDDVRSRRETGVGRQDLDIGLAQKVLTPNQMRTYELRRSAADYEYELSANIRDMPLEDIRTRLKTLKPAEGGEEYGRRSVAYNRTIAKVNVLRQTREKDPAGSIDTTAEVEQARALKDPHALMDARIAKQKAIGIPDQRQSPITREEAQALAAPLAGYKGAEIAKPLQDLSGQILKQYGAHGPGALRMVARVISQDREAQEVMMGEMEKMTRKPGMEVYNPRKLKELEEITKLELKRRPTPTGPEAYGPPQPVQPNTGALQHLLQNPHLAPFFDQKYGLAPGTGEKYLKQLGR